MNAKHRYRYIIIYNMYGIAGVLASIASLMCPIKTGDLPGLAEDWFLSAPSAARSDVAYVAVATYMIEAGYPGMERMVWLAEVASRNLPGSEAPDITVRMAKGGSIALSQLKGQDVILLFYDRDCAACAGMVCALDGSRVISDAIACGGLVIMAVDVGDSSGAGTFRIPSSWMDCMDEEGVVIREERYFIPYTPVVYLIGKDGIIKLKDAVLMDVERILTPGCKK